MNSPRSDYMLLRDLGTFHVAPMEERIAAAACLAERLGESWHRRDPVMGEDGLRFLHLPTEIEFVAIAGGRFEMGLSEADLEEASEHIDWTGEVAKLVKKLKREANPVHWVEVRPFLCARQLLDDEQVERLSGGRLENDTLTRDSARMLAQGIGFRLASEAELEWLGRDGGEAQFILDGLAREDERSRFGVEDLYYGQWAEDDWHPNYEGAPMNSAPWMGGDGRGVYRGGTAPVGWQSTEELIFLLAGVRFRAGKDEPSFMGVRVVAEIPG